MTVMKRFYAISAIRCTHFEVYNIYQILFWNSILHQNCHLFLMYQFPHQRLHVNQKCDSLCWIRKSPLFRSPVKRYPPKKNAYFASSVLAWSMTRTHDFRVFEISQVPLLFFFWTHFFHFFFLILRFYSVKMSLYIFW